MSSYFIKFRECRAGEKQVLLHVPTLPHWQYLPLMLGRDEFYFNHSFKTGCWCIGEWRDQYTFEMYMSYIVTLVQSFSYLESAVHQKTIGTLYRQHIHTMNNMSRLVYPSFLYETAEVTYDVPFLFIYKFIFIFRSSESPFCPFLQKERREVNVLENPSPSGRQLCFGQSAISMIEVSAKSIRLRECLHVKLLKVVKSPKTKWADSKIHSIVIS